MGLELSSMAYPQKQGLGILELSFTETCCLLFFLSFFKFLAKMIFVIQNDIKIKDFIKILEYKKIIFIALNPAAPQVPENIPSIPEMNSPLMQIESFLEALTNADKDGRMVLNRRCK